MTVEKPKPKQLLRQITTGANSAMNQSQFLAITYNSLIAREKSRVHDALGFAFRWLKRWRESFKPITKRSNRNHVITFDSHLKTALWQLVRKSHIDESRVLSLLRQHCSHLWRQSCFFVVLNLANKAGVNIYLSDTTSLTFLCLFIEEFFQLERYDSRSFGSNSSVDRSVGLIVT